ncbi:hypothetical protein [Mangrovicoccus algicola]|uniref:Peptidase C39-like domain-containing protein n=1 Tax=Mangrovicoccus algicola TaxID=2771008 RepID=A0A8J7CSU6_9RHOB|nr:hypothetical protein [Mangrovicoccus algicola]MBE3636614.1 hypothetical protein [Mangrovicoccus algicola]
MNRRDVLGGGAAACIATTMPGLARAGAAHGCYRAQPGEVRCQVGFPDAPFIDPQDCRSSCWANCLAYVLTGYGMSVSAGSVLWHMRRTGACGRDNDAARLMAATGGWVDDTGRSFLVTARRLGDLAAETPSQEAFAPLVEALSARPLIVGSAGHSMVLTEMSYVDAPGRPMRPETLTLRDPWTGTANLRHLAPAEAPERLFAVDIRIRRM